jgi:hypothetical protein
MCLQTAQTAGTEFRQYRGLLTDLEFGCPLDRSLSTGRSPPTASWTRARPTQSSYRDYCVAFIEQGWEPPILGCSARADIVMVVGAERPNLIDALITLEASIRPRDRRILRRDPLCRLRSRSDGS